MFSKRHIEMVISALFIIAQIWKQLKYKSAAGWINKL